MVVVGLETQSSLGRFYKMLPTNQTSKFRGAYAAACSAVDGSVDYVSRPQNTASRTSQYVYRSAANARTRGSSGNYFRQHLGTGASLGTSTCSDFGIGI